MPKRCDFPTSTRSSIGHRRRKIPTSTSGALGHVFHSLLAVRRRERIPDFGVGFFPMGYPDECRHNDAATLLPRSGCDPSMYDHPSGRDSQICPTTTSLWRWPSSSSRPAGPTLTRPALQGSLRTRSRWEFSHPGRRVVQDPDHPAARRAPRLASPTASVDCANTLAPSSPKTYVIAFGTDKSAFEPIAVAGGGEAFAIDIRDMMTDRLGEIIKQIRDDESGCEWAVPLASLHRASTTASSTSKSRAS